MLNCWILIFSKRDIQQFLIWTVFSVITTRQIEKSGSSHSTNNKSSIDTKNIGNGKIETGDLSPTTVETKFMMKGYDIPYIPGFRPIIDTIWFFHMIRSTQIQNYISFNYEMLTFSFFNIKMKSTSFNNQNVYEGS